MPKEEYLFRCHLPAKRLKEMVASAQAIGDVMTLELDSGNEDHPIRYWAVDDPKPRVAMVGVCKPSLFEAVGGNDEPHTVLIPTRKQFAPMVAAFDLKRNIEIRLLTEDNKYVLRLVQAKDDDAEPDVRTITVSAADGKPTTPIIAKVAYAAVDLARFAKVLAGLKHNTDVVTVSIRPDEFEVSANTKRLQDGWKHAGTASGKATGLFSAAFLRKAVQGASQASKFGEVHLANDAPLHLEASSEDLTAHFYVAGREVMV